MDVSAITSGTGTPASAVSDQTTAPAATPAGRSDGLPSSSASNAGKNQALTPAIAKLFGSSGSPHPVELRVSYRVDGNDIVTVFTDPKTGKEVAQFPPELLLGLAKFFDHQGGVTLDKSA